MKFNIPYPIRDILLIQSNEDNGIGNWQHPLIKKLIDKYCTPCELNEGYYDGPVVRAVYKKVTIVALLEENVFDNFVNECMSNKTKKPRKHTSLHLPIATMLLEDVWIPYDEQFCFTEYGKKLAEVFPYNVSYEFISPDIGIRLDDELYPNSNWGYCT
jgi:hypothetical protein